MLTREKSETEEEFSVEDLDERLMEFLLDIPDDELERMDVTYFEVGDDPDLFATMNARIYEVLMTNNENLKGLTPDEDGYVVVPAGIPPDEIKFGCDGCRKEFPVTGLTLHADGMGLGKFCLSCSNTLSDQKPTPLMVEHQSSWYSPLADVQEVFKDRIGVPVYEADTNRVLVHLSNASYEVPINDEGDGIQQPEIPLANDPVQGKLPATAPKQQWSQQGGYKSSTGAQGSAGTTKAQSGVTYAAKCGGHMDGFVLEAGGGKVIVSSSRHPLARLHEEADIALFFDQNSWEPKFRPIIKKMDIPENYEGPVELAGLPADDVSSNVPIIYFDWPDMKPPPATIRPWVEWAVSALRDGLNVQIGCIGGHGRTGTFFAMLLLEAGIADFAYEAVQLTRNMVCESTIETEGQVDSLYIYNGQATPKTGTAKKLIPTEEEEFLKDIDWEEVLSVKEELKKEKKTSEVVETVTMSTKKGK